MDRILRTICMTLGALLASSCAYGTTLVAINPDNTDVTIGSTFNVFVELESDSPNISGFDLAIVFPTFLNAQSVTEEGYFAVNGVLGLSPTIDNVGGSITGIFDAAIGPDYTLGIPSGGFPSVPIFSTDVLLSLQFVALAQGTGLLTIECDNGNDCAGSPMLSDDNLNAIPVDGSIPGGVTVDAAPPPSGTSAPEPAFGLLLAPLLAALLKFRAKANEVPHAAARD